MAVSGPWAAAAGRRAVVVTVMARPEGSALRLIVDHAMTATAARAGPLAARSVLGVGRGAQFRQQRVELPNGPMDARELAAAERRRVVHRRVDQLAQEHGVVSVLPQPFVLVGPHINVDDNGVL